MATAEAIVLLTVGALLLGGSAFRISARFGLDPVVSGVVLVGFATSFPEVISAGVAAESGAGELAFATLVGSNAFNSLFILGVVMLVARPGFRYDAIRWDAWASFAVCLVPFAALLTQEEAALRRVLALLCLCALGAYTLHAVVDSRRPMAPEIDGEGAGRTLGRRLATDLAAGILGVALLTSGSADLVEGVLFRWPEAPDIAGSTLVAVATSFPELFVALYAALRGWTAIAVGSVLGSNVFNMLGALGGVLLVAPLPRDGGHPLLDAIIMTSGAGLILLLLGRPARASRWLAASMASSWIAVAAIRIGWVGG